MGLESAEQRLVALPVQIIETNDGVILKRGCTEIRVSSKAAREVLYILFSSTGERGATSTELLQQFAVPHRQFVAELIDKLVAQRFFVPETMLNGTNNGPESHREIFYWNFGQSDRDVTYRLNAQHIAILGVNYISRQLANSLLASGVKEARVVDYPLLRNLRLFNEAGKVIDEQWPDSLSLPLAFEEWASNADSWHCVVATSDFGGQQAMGELNRLCVKHQRHFLPVILEKMVGCVGPLVIPGETACFECLRARRNSHLDDPSIGDMDDRAFEGQVVTGFHPTMASILGDIAAFELIKFYSGVLPGWNISVLIEINLLRTQSIARRVLKIPCCTVCSPLNTKPTTNLQKHAFSKREERDYEGRTTGLSAPN